MKNEVGMKVLIIHIVDDIQDYYGRVGVVKPFSNEIYYIWRR